MDNIYELIGFSMGFGFNELLKGNQVCILVIKTEAKLKIMCFEDDDNNIRNSHHKAIDYLRQLEYKNEWYDKATLTYDGYLTTNGEKNDALITRIFSLDTHANRRVAQRYIKKTYEIQLKDDLFFGGDWDFETIEQSKLIERMNREIKESA